MPEGHTIHRAAKDHDALFAGESLHVTSPQGRFDASPLYGRGAERTSLARVDAYGKHLFYVFERGRTVHVHLGLFGKFYKHKADPPPPRASTRMRIAGPKGTIDLVGPTACEIVSKAAQKALLARLGPDPLRDDADPSAFFDYLARSKTPVGAALLDQSVIAGVGNVYRAEVLHMLKLHPLTDSRAVSRDERERLWALLVGLMRRGVAERRIVTTQGLELAVPRKRVLRAESTFVYGRGECRTCGGEVSRFALRARTAHVCTRCQPYRVRAK